MDFKCTPVRCFCFFVTHFGANRTRAEVFEVSANERTNGRDVGSARRDAKGDANGGGIDGDGGVDVARGATHGRVRRGGVGERSKERRRRRRARLFRETG